MTRTTFLAIVSFASLAGYATTMQGDITAAIRNAGLATSVVVDPSASVDNNAEQLVDGLTVDRYLTASGVTGPVDFTFTIPDGFLPGEDVVLTGVTFCVTNKWGDYKLRMPKSMVIQGSSDNGSTWQTICSASGFSEYSLSGGLYSGTCSFANWKSFRTYRVSVTEATGSTSYFLQICEIALVGLYGGNVEQPEPVLIDVSESVRRAGRQTCRTNAGNSGITINVDCAFNGVWENDRYLSLPATTKELLDAGQTIDVDYCISNAFCRSADIVITAYTIGADLTQYGSKTLPRLPKSWQLQGSNDGETWTLLDAVSGFCAWETKEMEGRSYYTYTFKFVNSASYRQYRLSVSELYDRSKSDDMFQVSEIQLFGYVDVGIAGRVGTTMDGMAINMAAHEETGAYAAQISVSQYEQGISTDGGTVTNLFDGVYATEFLARLGTDADELGYAPLTVGYEFPDAYLAGKELVLKKYTLCSRTTVAQYENRMPATWRLEGFAGVRWVRIDKKTGFNDWETSGDANRYFKTFSLPDNLLSCRRYRLLFYDSHGISSFHEHNTMHQIRLCEIELEGEWGTGISKPYRCIGLILSFR